MLIKRLITAIIIAPIAVFGILMLNQNGFALALSIILIVGSFEYCNLIKITTLIGRLVYTFLILAAAYAISKDSLMLPFVLYASAIWWLAALGLVLRFPKGADLLNTSLFVKLINGFFLFVPMAASLIVLHLKDPQLVLFLVGLIWAADIGAYFAGRFFGKNKLCPGVSPGKTREGLYGGIFLSQIVALLYVFTSVESLPENAFLMFGFLALVVSLVSVLGDLFESVLKRIAGVKDSGKILPGHGGVLDRIDSLTSSAPIFFILFMFLI